MYTHSICPSGSGVERRSGRASFDTWLAGTPARPGRAARHLWRAFEVSFSLPASECGSNCGKIKGIAPGECG